MFKRIVASLGCAFLAACSPRSDIVSMDKVSGAKPEEKAATCIKGNLMPNSTVPAYIRVGLDGQTVSVSRYTPGLDRVSDSSSERIEVSLFNNRGIGDAGAGAFTVLAFGDDNDKAMVAMMENCVFENMPGVMNYELLPPLPAPVGYKSLAALTNSK